MENNLEHIPKEKVYRFDGLSYLEFRKNLIPDFKIVWQDIGKAYFLIIFFFVLSLNLENLLGGKFWMLVPILSLFIGLYLAHLKLYIHEAAHHHIAADKTKNDKLANILLCPWWGTRIQSYRENHLKHHQLLGTKNDSENAYFNRLSFKLLIYYLSGTYFLEKCLGRIVALKEIKSKSKTVQMLVFGATLHGSVLLIASYFGCHYTVLVWLIAICMFLPFFSQLRQILEHRNEWAESSKDFTKEDHGKICRMFERTFFSKIFGGAGFNRHMLHHWDPEISYTRFDELEEFLMNTPQCWVSIVRSKTTYFDTFLSLVRF